MVTGASTEGMVVYYLAMGSTKNIAQAFKKPYNVGAGVRMNGVLIKEKNA